MRTRRIIQIYSNRMPPRDRRLEASRATRLVTAIGTQVQQNRKEER